MKLNTNVLKRSSIGLAALALVALPVAASAVSDNSSTVINASIGSTISVSSESPVAISLTPTGDPVVSSASDTVTVSTNNSAGYTLTLADADANTDLVSSGNSIPAHDGTQVTPTALANNTWGYAVAGVGGFDGSYTAEEDEEASTSTWAGVPASGSPVQLKSTSSTAANEVTTVWYAVKVDSTQPTGTYTNTVTYTATTK